ncbi:MAG: AAA family ATPase [Muribaculaceae bacterium]|nr:AAA family ATPase [Muribaculaceae bacterium]
MKLLKLEILNLASLDNKDGEVVNFEEGALRDASIFSIVGPTGSGKSTLLDAICLALYNRAPRYPRKKGDRGQKIEIFGNADKDENGRLAPTDGRNILTNGKKDGYSKLTFLANNGMVYRAEWHVHRKRSNFEDVVTLLYEIRQTEGKYSEEVRQWNDLPSIIGLDYEQFLRTVLIAQGSFANFLTAKEEERYQLLEKLIGCEGLYSTIAEQIRAKRDEAQKRLDTINAQVEAEKNSILSDEELAALKENIAALEAAEKALNEQIKDIAKALEWYDTEGRLVAEIIRQKALEAEAQTALDSIKADIEKLSLYDAIRPALDLLSDAKKLDKAVLDADKAIADIEANIADLTASIAAKKAEKDNLDANALAAQKAIDDTTPHINKARELRTLIDAETKTYTAKKSALTSAANEKKKADKALTDNAKNIADAKQKKQAASAALAELKAEIEAKKAQLLEDEANAQQALDAEKQKLDGQSAEALQQAREKAVTNLTDLTSAIDIVARINGCDDTIRQHSNRKIALTKENEEITAQRQSLPIDALAAEVEVLNNSYTLMTSEKWDEHRGKLEDGKPCPLCGGTHHPYATDTAQFDAATSELHRLLAEKKKALEDLQKTEKQLAEKFGTNAGELRSLAKSIEKAQADLVKEEQNWANIAGKQPDWQRDKSALESMKESFEAAKTSTQKALTAYNKLQQDVQRLQAVKEKATQAKADYNQRAAEKLDKAQGRANDAETLLVSHEAQTQNLVLQQQEKDTALQNASDEYAAAEKQLATLNQQFNTELGGKNPDEVESQLNAAKKAADEAVSRKAEEITAQENKLSNLSGSLSTQKAQKTQTQQNMAEKTSELDLWIEEYNSNADAQISVAIVDSLLMADDNWSLIREQKETRQKALTSATTLRNNAENQHNDHQQAKPEKSAEELTQEKEALEQNSKKNDLIQAGIKLKQHNEALQRMGDKADELALATLEHKDWKEVCDAIGPKDGMQLRKIAQCYTLRFLVEHANYEIRKFNSRYELQQVKNSLGIRVIDHDRADDVRDTTSLSGGETFIVSLGLALGLSALSSRSISFDNLFIDEGFGTLDPDTLATVIDSLAMLQTAQGKKVGVISHTDTMSERITTQIRIIPNGANGSSHIEIYPF